MNDYVLFSCVGGHDPVASYADGAILHFVAYIASKGCIIFIKRNVGKENMDDRYRKVLYFYHNSMKILI